LLDTTLFHQQSDTSTTIFRYRLVITFLSLCLPLLAVGVVLSCIPQQGQNSPLK